MKNSKNSGYTKENLKDEVMTKPSTQTEDEVIVIDAKDGVDLFGEGELYLNLSKPGKYYITDITNIGRANMYFGLTQDGKIRYVMSRVHEGASIDEEVYGQYVTVPIYHFYSKDMPLYVEVFDRHAEIYTPFEV